MPTVATGLRAQDSWATDREDLDFADRIALLNPNENPLTLLAMRFGKGNSGNVKHQWIDDETQPTFDKVAGAVATAATTFDVDNGGRFAIGDLVRDMGGNYEVMLVTAISTDELTVDRDYGEAGTPGYNARARQIPDNGDIEIISNAFEQGHPLPVIKNTQEIVRVNFTQDKRTPAGITEIAAAAAVHGEQDWPYQMRKKGIEHMNQLETMNIWGVPEVGDQGAFVSGTGNTGPQAAGGIFFYIDEYADATKKVTQSDLTQSEFLDFLEAGFEFGSHQKLLLAPSLMRSAIDFWGIAKLNTVPEDTAFGIDVSRWISSHGKVVIITHKLLKDKGTNGVTSFLLDLDEIKWITYSNIGATKVRNLHSYESDGSTIKEAEYQTIGCIEMRQANKHAYIDGTISYS